MKLLHTSDWHLGKRLFKLERTQEHELYLDWLFKIIKENEIDYLLICGDVFDTPTPPHFAQEMYYEFLYRLSINTTCEVLIIAGNHDSGQLLEAPKKILKDLRITIWGKLSDNPQNHWMTLTKGNVSLDVCAIPFFRSYEILNVDDKNSLDGLSRYFTYQGPNPKLLMLHHLAGIVEGTGSEQVISLSGIDCIPTDFLKQFDYVAMGHIHKSMKISNNIFYCGSPLPMRFSEKQTKEIRIIEIDENGLKSSPIEIPVFRKLFLLEVDEGNWAQTIQDLEIENGLKPVVEIKMTLTKPVIGLIDEIKKELEKKEIELLSYQPFYQQGSEKQQKNEKIFQLSPLELFKEFYVSKYPEQNKAPEELVEEFAELIQRANDASHTTQN